MRRECVRCRNGDSESLDFKAVGPLAAAVGEVSDKWRRGGDSNTIRNNSVCNLQILRLPRWLSMPSLPWLLGPYWPMVEVDINAVAPRSRADSARIAPIGWWRHPGMDRHRSGGLPKTVVAFDVH
jgi:hypothetical protein